MRKIRSLAVVMGVGVALVACQGPERSGNVDEGQGGPDAIEVTMLDTAFRPNRLDLDAGEEVTIEVTNKDSTDHDFTMDSLDLSTGEMESGDVMTATFVVPDGETPFVCTLHGGMEGVIAGG